MAKSTAGKKGGYSNRPKKAGWALWQEKDHKSLPEGVYVKVAENTFKLKKFSQPGITSAGSSEKIAGSF